MKRYRLERTGNYRSIDKCIIDNNRCDLQTPVIMLSYNVLIYDSSIQYCNKRKVRLRFFVNLTRRWVKK